MSDDKISAVGTNIAEKATVIWNVADMLRGPFKPHEYGLVILPMTVVKRFHDCLLPTHAIDIIEYARGIAAKQINIIQLMTFYSIGRWIVEEQQQGESRANMVNG